MKEPIKINNWFIKMAAKNAYELLGVDESASVQAIREAFRIQVLKVHPDISQPQSDSSITIELLINARDTLCDPILRGQLDLQMKLEAIDTYNHCGSLTSIENFTQLSDGSFAYNCRCGDKYRVSSLTLSLKTAKSFLLLLLLFSNFTIS